MAGTHKVSEIKDLDPAMISKLGEANISTVEELLDKSNTPQEKAALANTLGVTPSQLTEWINRGDLMRLKGVGKEFANLLESCGVDSCKELQHRKAENLYNKLKETNDEKKIAHHAPSQTQVEAWIQEAAVISAAA
jgi:predicted flap endonuclease-1-like 5' DNA nuclease